MAGSASGGAAAGGGAAYNEWRKAQERAEAQALGDAIIAALGEEERAARTAALDAIQTETGGARAIVGLLAAGEGGAEMAPETAEQLLSWPILPRSRWFTARSRP